MAFLISDATSTASTTQQILGTSTDIGVITSTGALVTTTTAIGITGPGGFLVNDGLVVSNINAISANASFTLVNRGLMTAESTAITINDGTSLVTTTRITNLGDIVSAGAVAISSSDAGLAIENDGTIVARGTAINLSGSDLTVRNTILNSGLIEGRPIGATENAIVSNGELKLVNTGTIIGNVDLGAGDDTVDNRFGAITGRIDLAEGINVFRGGIGDESVSGGDSADVIRGGGGDDRIQGFGGNDSLLGGDGDDTIIGGLGEDTMTGGQGADLFIFSLVAESSIGQDADIITDFNRKDDLVDLAFAASDTIFVGRDALLGGGAASFGYERVGSMAVVLVDVNGDGLADFHLEMLNTKSLSADDFVI